jgi:hypothetical protein
MATETSSYEVTLEDLVESHYQLRRENQIATEAYRQIESEHKEIRQQFTAHYGKLKREFYAEHLIAAVILTDQGYLGVMGDLFLESHTMLKEILIECSLKARKAYRLLKDTDPESLSATNEDYYAAASSVLAYLDRIRAGEGRDDLNITDEADVIKMISDIVDAANDTLDKSLSRMAKTQYFIGMVTGAKIWLGTTSMMILLIVSTYYIWEFPNSEKKMFWNLLLLAVSFFSGGMGALVSVMSRMGLRRIELDTESGHILLKRLGVFRVLMGAILGMGLYSLVRGQIIPLNLNVSNLHDQLYAYAGIAFLGGFAERWAQDMLSAASQRIAVSTSEKIKKSITD